MSLLRVTVLRVRERIRRGSSSPVVVDEYLIGDNGVLILLGTAAVAWWLARRPLDGGRPDPEHVLTTGGSRVSH